MKILHLLRHAKSGWDDPSLSDRDRELNARGRGDAPRMGAALSKFIEPMAITVSPARRAQLTLAGLCDGWPALAEFEHITDESLYTFSSADHLRWIAAQDEAQDAIFMISHNPGLTDLVNTLTVDFTLGNLPTAGYVQLSLDIGRWDQLAPCVAQLEHRLFPKQLA